MSDITDISALEALYGTPAEASIIKVADHLTPLYAKWIRASRFVVLTTVGPEGTDGSPRGDVGPVAHMHDAKTLLIPDWRGNNRMDSLRNIVRDGRVSLMFMVPGSNTVVRVNGQAVVSVDEGLLHQFEQKGAHPRSVIKITVAEVYTQCARALIRSELWAGSPKAPDLPTVGAFLAEAKEGYDGESYDAQWAARAEKTMW
ncbi:pyridoxamine 5'-phosphate oxidase family protein [Algirhabdus cladophorae]|uniref:pyridoxamine 5'-phosphate oxidase family protein n=1 Tax=Algirhabdus cladophorae TaxID=3377108 RepID=UPI003B84AD41